MWVRVSTARGDVRMRAERGVNADVGAGVADIGQGRQPVAGRGVQRGQGMNAGGAQVVHRAGLDCGDPQQGAVGRGEELEVSGEAPSLAGVPQVVAPLGGAGHAVAGDERAVQHHMAQALRAAAFQDLVQVRSARGEDIDPFAGRCHIIGCVGL
ncbi:hypothetical protein GCM10027162_44690 [Streptomyces incanus]